MKIYISVDIEGINGINSWDETNQGTFGYTQFQKQMTKEVVAVCEALTEQGVKEIVIRDAHDSARNILIEDLPENVKIIRGWSGGICDMMFGLDESFSGIIYIGYHSPSLGTKGNFLAHTLTSSSINYIKFNDNVVSEYDINTLYAKTFKVPVIMLSGDKALCEAKAKESSHLVTAFAFEGFYGATLAVSPKKHLDNLKKSAKEALATLEVGIDYDLTIPNFIKAEICYKDLKNAYRNSFYPGAQLVEPNLVVYTSNTYIDILKFLKFCL